MFEIEKGSELIRKCSERSGQKKESKEIPLKNK